MKTIIFIAVIALTAAASDLYYFFEDLDSVLDNGQEFEDFVDCILGKSQCKVQYEPYEDLFSAAVKDKCQKCTPYQRHFFRLFLNIIRSKSPENYINFRMKYDPENKYLDAMMKELKDE